MTILMRHNLRIANERIKSTNEFMIMKSLAFIFFALFYSQKIASCNEATPKTTYTSENGYEIGKKLDNARLLFTLGGYIESIAIYKEVLKSDANNRPAMAGLQFIAKYSMDKSKALHDEGLLHAAYNMAIIAETAVNTNDRAIQFSKIIKQELDSIEKHKELYNSFDNKSIRDLAFLGDLLFDTRYISLPRENNSILAYKLILEIEPNHEIATKKLLEISEYCFRKAYEYFNRGWLKSSAAWIFVGLEAYGDNSNLFKLKKKLLREIKIYYPNTNNIFSDEQKTWIVTECAVECKIKTVGMKKITYSKIFLPVGDNYDHISEEIINDRSALSYVFDRIRLCENLPITNLECNIIDDKKCTMKSFHHEYWVPDGKETGPWIPSCTLSEIACKAGINRYCKPVR